MAEIRIQEVNLYEGELNGDEKFAIDNTGEDEAYALKLSQITTYVQEKSSVSSFTNDAGYITSSDIPEVPTAVSDLTNDANYVTLTQMNQAIAQVEISGGATNLATDEQSKLAELYQAVKNGELHTGIVYKGYPVTNYEITTDSYGYTYIRFKYNEYIGITHAIDGLTFRKYFSSIDVYEDGTTANDVQRGTRLYNIPFETWTFTLDDNTTVNKNVYIY